MERRNFMVRPAEELAMRERNLEPMFGASGTSTSELGS